MADRPDRTRILAEILNMLMEPAPVFTSAAKTVVLSLHADAVFVPLDPKGDGVVCIPSIGWHDIADAKPNQEKAWQHILDKLRSEGK